MAHLVGTKGQVVIAKEIRDRLGVQAGWLALQRLVDDHVEVYFIPPKHRRTLKGSLRKYITARVPPGPEWRRARDFAWTDASKNEIGAEGRAP